MTWFLPNNHSDPKFIETGIDPYYDVRTNEQPNSINNLILHCCPVIRLLIEYSTDPISNVSPYLIILLVSKNINVPIKLPLS